MSKFTESLEAFIEEELGYGNYVSEFDGEVTIITNEENFSFKWECVQENKDNPDFWYWVDEQIDAIEIQTTMEQTYLDIYRLLPGKIIAEIGNIRDIKTIWEGVALIFNLLEEV